MAVDFMDLDSHKNVYSAILGRGDVYISYATQPETGRCFIMFHNTDEVGVPLETTGKQLEEIPLPDMVIHFEDPATINRMIRMLSIMLEETFLSEWYLDL